MKEMNRIGMLVDVAHCGTRTSLEALGLTAKPAVVSHAGCSAVYGHPRNVSDDVIRAVRDAGGVIGIPAAPSFLGHAPANLEQMVRHVMHAVEVAGPQHVAYSGDFYREVWPYVSLDEQAASDREAMEGPLWDPGDFHEVAAPFAVETPAGFPRLIEALRPELGEENLDAFRGDNWVRVFDAAWAV